MSGPNPLGSGLNRLAFLQRFFGPRDPLKILWRREKDLLNDYEKGYINADTYRERLHKVIEDRIKIIK